MVESAGQEWLEEQYQEGDLEEREWLGEVYPWEEWVEQEWLEVGAKCA